MGSPRISGTGEGKQFKFRDYLSLSTVHRHLLPDRRRRFCLRDANPVNTGIVSIDVFFVDTARHLHLRQLSNVTLDRIFVWNARHS